jgi:hypothetical protein
MKKSSTRQKQIADKRRFWKEHIDSWKADDLKPADYCRQHQLNIHTFRYWKKKFADLQSPGTSFVQIYPPQVLKLRPACSSSSPLRVLVGNYKIEVPSGFDPVTLKQLVHTLGRL